MIRLTLIMLVLATPASAATLVDRLHCWAYPHHERCRPPQPTPEPAQAPVPAPAPPQVVTPEPAPAAAPAPARKAKPRVKSKPKLQAVAKVQRKKARIANWCARIPKGTSMGTVEFWAPSFGVTMTPANRRQVQDCLNSK